jgi:hypothetical protein
VSRPNWLNRKDIEKHSVDIRQFIGMRESTLPNGMRVIDAHNSSGLTLTLLPDRGMDIFSASYKGMPLTWINQGAPFPPDGGLEWLRQFNGGLLTTCGLTHVGPPEHDDQTNEFRDIHGHYSRLRAFDISVRGSWTSSNYEMKLTAELAQSRLHGEQLAVTRRYNWKLGEPRVNIVDFITNHSDKPVPLMVLYHFNMGYPIVQSGTELAVASDVYTRDDVAKDGVNTWNIYDGAQSGYQEQVFYHHVKNDPAGRAHAGLVNDNIGLKFSWKTDTLPYLTQWKNTRKNMYINGIEPGNCVPEGQNQARKSGRIAMLEPDEMMTFSLTVEVLENLTKITDFKRQVDIVAKSGQPVQGCNLAGYDKYIDLSAPTETAIHYTDAIEGIEDIPKQE